MERAGYLQKTRVQALDCDGQPHEVLEVHILGGRFAIRMKQLAGALAGKVVIQVEELTHNYSYYLGSTCGLGQVSHSGKALNISLFHEGNFTVSLSSIRAVMYGRERNAVIVRIPESALPARIRRVAQGQQQIPASV